MNAQSIQSPSSVPSPNFLHPQSIASQPAPSPKLQPPPQRIQPALVNAPKTRPAGIPKPATFQSPQAHNLQPSRPAFVQPQLQQSVLPTTPISNQPSINRPPLQPMAPPPQNSQGVVYSTRPPMSASPSPVSHAPPQISSPLQPNLSRPAPAGQIMPPVFANPPLQRSLNSVQFPLNYQPAPVPPTVAPSHLISLNQPQLAKAAPLQSLVPVAASSQSNQAVMDASSPHQALINPEKVKKFSVIFLVIALLAIVMAAFGGWLLASLI